MIEGGIDVVAGEHDSMRVAVCVVVVVVVFVNFADVVVADIVAVIFTLETVLNALQRALEHMFPSA